YFNATDRSNFKLLDGREHAVLRTLEGTVLRINKITVILIFFFLISLAPIYVGSSNVDSMQSDEDNSLKPDVVDVGHPNEKVLNASIRQVDRNITITQTSRIVLQDKILLKVHDNTTEVTRLNYTVPTSFSKFVEKIDFYSQIESDEDLETTQNTRSYTVYVGEEATTYSIDIVQDG
ncbi:MAG: hypothetical protein ACW98K_10685, partial [Candidatus Kariarchaeaceae archaeon]